LPKPDSSENKPNQREYDALAVAKFVLGFFGLCAIIAYTSVNAWQGYLTRQSLITASEAAKAAQESADAAVAASALGSSSMATKPMVLM
jgi:hypothetical protein